MEQDFERLYEVYSTQVRALQQIRADALTALGNFGRLFQSLDATSKSLRVGIEGGGGSSGGFGADVTALKAVECFVENQDALVNVVYRSVETEMKTKFVSSIDAELLRARDVLFRMNTRKRLSQEVENLRPRMSTAQVAEYVKDLRTEHDALTAGLRETMTAAIPRRKALFHGLLPQLIELQKQILTDTSARLQETITHIGVEELRSLKVDIEEHHGTSMVGEGRELERDWAAGGDNAAVRASSATSEEDRGVNGERNTPIVELNEELKKREEMRRRQEQEVKKQAEEKLAQHTEREEAENKDRDELALAKERLAPAIMQWTKNDQLRGNLAHLLAGLDRLLGEQWNWKAVTLEAVSEPSRAKRTYFKAILLVHPDKVVGKDVETRALSELVFDELQNAWLVASAEMEGNPPPPGSVGPRQPNFGQHDTTATTGGGGGGMSHEMNNMNMGMNMPGMGYNNMGYGMAGGMGMAGMQMPQGYGMGYNNMGYNNMGGMGMHGMNMNYNMGYGMMGGNMGINPGMGQQGSQMYQQQHRPQQQQQQQQQQHGGWGGQTQQGGTRQK